MEIQWAVIGVIIAVQTFDKARSAWKRRNGNPGYGTRLTKLETKMNDVKEDVKAIKNKLNLI